MPMRPRSRQVREVAPHEVVVSFLSRRRLERRHLDASRVDPGHHVLDCPALAGGVERLEHEEDAPLVLGIELLLKVAQPVHAFGERRLGGLLVRLEPGGVVRIDVLQPELGAFLDEIRLDEVAHVDSGHDRSRFLSPRTRAGRGSDVSVRPVRNSLDFAILAVLVDRALSRTSMTASASSIRGQVTLSKVRRVRFRASSGWMSRLATFTMP